MADRVEIFKIQRRGIGTFQVHPEDDVLESIIGKTGYVEAMEDRWDEELGLVIGTNFSVCYEGVDATFLMTDEDGIFTPDPPMTFQRKIQLLNEEDRYVESMEP